MARARAPKLKERRHNMQSDDDSDYGGRGDIFPYLGGPSLDFSSGQHGFGAPVTGQAQAAKAYVPYKNSVLPGRGKLLTFARSLCGKVRRIFQREIKSWCYIKLPDADSDPGRTASLLKEELSTDGVTYDETFRAFRVEPSEAVTKRVREIAQEIIPASFTTYSILSSLGRRFFSQIDENGEWMEMPSEDEVSMADLTDSARAAIRTVIWTAISGNIVAFVESRPAHCEAWRDQTVHIWTTHRSLAQNKALAASAASSILRSAPYPRRDAGSSEDDPVDDDDYGLSQPSFEIRVRHFETPDELTAEISRHVEKNYDIAVHYGDECASANPVMDALTKLKSLEGESAIVDVFDLREYIENVYTDMPSHSFRSVASEISLVDQTQIDGGAAGESPPQNPRSSEDAITVGAMSVFTAADEERLDAFITRFGFDKLMHTEENAIYILQNVAARAFLVGRLFSVLSKAIFDLMYLSGCNMSTLTKRDHTSRGVVSFIDSMAACAQIVDTLPHDYMEPGVHSRTYVTPFSSMLIAGMMESEDPTTAVIGNMIQPLRGYGWLVREIFSLRSLKPAPPLDIPGSFGLFRGMVYSTEPIDGHNADRQWSSILYVGLGSWIGITIDASAPAGLDGSPSDMAGISFGYFGIEDVCRHPFDAVRIAVETYLSLRIRSNSNASPRTVVASMVTGKVLNDENTAVRRRITAANLHVYASLVPEHDRRLIASGEKTVTMNLWYQEDGKSFTTTPMRLDKRVYIGILEDILTRVFVPILPPPVPPPAPPPAPVIVQTLGDVPCEEPDHLRHDGGYPPTPGSDIASHRPHSFHSSGSRHQKPNRHSEHSVPVAVIQARAPERGVFRSIVHPHAGR